jgi:hypothetical protein
LELKQNRFKGQSNPMAENLYKALSEKFPFISIIQYGDSADEYVGIIQNTDNTITSIYDFGLLKSDDEKRLFLTLGEKWYYESNRQLPINIYLKHEWSLFDKIFKTFITKEVTIIHGPSVSLNNLSQKKKRRSVMIVKKLN